MNVTDRQTPCHGIGRATYSIADVTKHFLVKKLKHFGYEE